LIYFMEKSWIWKIICLMYCYFHFLIILFF